MWQYAHSCSLQGAPMSHQLTRKELRDGIKQKTKEAQVLFSKVATLYFDDLHSRISILKNAGHTATASDLEYQYNDFVPRYHSFCDSLATPGRFVSTKRLRHVHDEWNRLILYLAGKPTFFTERADPAKEAAARETIALWIERIGTANQNINSILSEHIEEIREESPSVLSALSLIPTLSQLAKKLREIAHFEDIHEALVEVSEIAHRAELIHLSLAQRFVK